MAGLGSSRQSSHLQRCARKGWGKWDSWSGSSQWNKIPIRRRRVPTGQPHWNRKNKNGRWLWAEAKVKSRELTNTAVKGLFCWYIKNRLEINSVFETCASCQALHHCPSCHRRTSTSDSGTLDPVTKCLFQSQKHKVAMSLLNPSSR